MDIKLTHIDTACCLLEIDGYKILTDPVFDPPGKYYHHGYGSVSKKTSYPSIDEQKIAKIDLILLSHPQHKDNFDNKGREIAKNVPLILSTKKIEKNFKNGIGLKAWEKYLVKLPNGNEITITATPAQHHPLWLPKFFAGEVIGFIIEHSASEQVIYITGDTVFFKGIKNVAEKYPNISICLIHVGSAQFRYLIGFGKFTMNRKGFIKTIKTLNPKTAIPIHNNGWTHFKENDEGLKNELLKHSEIKDKVLFLLNKEEEKLSLN